MLRLRQAMHYVPFVMPRGTKFIKTRTIIRYMHTCSIIALVSVSFPIQDAPIDPNQKSDKIYSLININVSGISKIVGNVISMT